LVLTFGSNSTRAWLAESELSGRGRKKKRGAQVAGASAGPRYCLRITVLRFRARLVRPQGPGSGEEEEEERDLINDLKQEPPGGRLTDTW